LLISGLSADRRLQPPADNSLAHELRPLEDARWTEFVSRHARSSIFHTAAWLEALRRTYGYEPLVITTSPSSEPLQNALVFCRIESWITGRRWVSLPFSDHCEPLVDSAAQLRSLLAALESAITREKLRYVEIRPLGPLATERGSAGSGRWQPGLQYCFHELDLSPPIETLFRNCHKDSTQRKIRRAEKEKLTHDDGRSDALMDAFYGLLIRTRRRHGLPPQPKKWFRNLADCFGDALKIRVASKGTLPVAAILTIRHKDVLVYKYGCSDGEYNNLGGTHLLFWRSIEEAKREGLRTFDLGRSDAGNQGLITFKDRWGAASSTLSYATLNASVPKQSLAPSIPGWKEEAIHRVFSRLPDKILRLIGALAYKHIG
jgi:CelD/BcsL family acetyltransferase involved in cellulose biosynthesis